MKWRKTKRHCTFRDFIQTQFNFLFKVSYSLHTYCFFVCCLHWLTLLSYISPCHKSFSSQAFYYYYFSPDFLIHFFGHVRVCVYVRETESDELWILRKIFIWNLIKKEDNTGSCFASLFFILSTLEYNRKVQNSHEGLQEVCHKFNPMSYKIITKDILFYSGGSRCFFIQNKRR